jgi:phage-related tail fiber protein
MAQLGSSTIFGDLTVTGLTKSDLEGNSSTASTLQTSRTISLTGDITGSVSFNGSSDAAIAATYKNSGVTAGTYKSVTVDVKGNVTAGTNPTTLSGYGITDAAPINSPTLTGTPLSTTAAQTVNNTQIATTAFVKSNFLTSGSTATNGAVKYNGTTALAGNFDGGTTTPTGTTRLNYGGYFYPTFLNLVGSVDTTTAATHYFVETGTDGFVRPKTLANVRTEVVTKAAVEASLTGTITTHTHKPYSVGTTSPADTNLLWFDTN